MNKSNRIVNSDMLEIGFHPLLFLLFAGALDMTRKLKLHKKQHEPLQLWQHRNGAVLWFHHGCHSINMDENGLRRRASVASVARISQPSPSSKTGVRGIQQWILQRIFTGTRLAAAADKERKESVSLGFVSLSLSLLSLSLSLCFFFGPH